MYMGTFDPPPQSLPAACWIWKSFSLTVANTGMNTICDLKLRFLFFSLAILGKLPFIPTIQVHTARDCQSTLPTWEKFIGITKFGSAFQTVYLYVFMFYDSLVRLFSIPLPASAIPASRESDS
jgi:hypothetical protein